MEVSKHNYILIFLSTILFFLTLVSVTDAQKKKPTSIIIDYINEQEVVLEENESHFVKLGKKIITNKIILEKVRNIDSINDLILELKIIDLEKRIDNDAIELKRIIDLSENNDIKDLNKLEILNLLILIDNIIKQSEEIKELLEILKKNKINEELRIQQ